MKAGPAGLTLEIGTEAAATMRRPRPGRRASLLAVGLAALMAIGCSFGCISASPTTTAGQVPGSAPPVATTGQAPELEAAATAEPAGFPSMQARGHRPGADALPTPTGRPGDYTSQEGYRDGYAAELNFCATAEVGTIVTDHPDRGDNYDLGWRRGAEDAYWKDPACAGVKHWD